jgi:hypothetical protein
MGRNDVRGILPASNGFGTFKKEMTGSIGTENEGMCILPKDL